MMRIVSLHLLFCWKIFVGMSIIIMVNLKRKYYELNNVVKCDIFVLSKRERR